MGLRLGPFLLWSGLTLVLLVGIVLRTAWYPAIAPLAAPVADRAQVARGAQLARLGNCASCHTVASGQPFAGGRPLRTPFGTIYGTNITPDRNTVTVFTGKAELGQGIKTALIQVAAEQLEVDPRAVHLITTDTGQTPEDGYTAGSQSMQDSGMAVLHAAAQVRSHSDRILAAARLDVAPKRLQGRAAVRSWPRTAAGFVTANSSPMTSCTCWPRRSRSLKDPTHHALLSGQSLPARRHPSQDHGRVAFVDDLRLPGMVHARVVRPPSPGARLRILSTRAAWSPCRACSKSCGMAITSRSRPSASSRPSPPCGRLAAVAPEWAALAAGPGQSVFPSSRKPAGSRFAHHPRSARSALPAAVKNPLEAHLSATLPDARVDRPFLRGRSV